jgi:hypothetical protein
MILLPSRLFRSHIFGLCIPLCCAGVGVVGYHVRLCRNCGVILAGPLGAAVCSCCQWPRPIALVTLKVGLWLRESVDVFVIEQTQRACLSALRLFYLAVFFQLGQQLFLRFYILFGRFDDIWIFLAMKLDEICCSFKLLLNVDIFQRRLVLLRLWLEVSAICRRCGILNIERLIHRGWRASWTLSPMAAPTTAFTGTQSPRVHGSTMSVTFGISLWRLISLDYSNQLLTEHFWVIKFFFFMWKILW